MGTRAVVATANVKTRILARAAADRCHSSEGAIAGWIEGLLATPQSSSHAPMGTRVVGRARRRLSGGIAARICSKCQGFEGSSPTGYLAAPPNGPALSAPLVRMEGNRPRRSRTPGRRGNSRYFLRSKTGCVDGAPSRGGALKSKQSHMSPDRSPGASAGVLQAGRPKSRKQNFTTLTCERKL